jgi:hypothetical protein
VTQVVECLPSKYEALSSNVSATKKKEKIFYYLHLTPKRKEQQKKGKTEKGKVEEAVKQQFL